MAVTNLARPSAQAKIHEELQRQPIRVGAAVWIVLLGAAAFAALTYGPDLGRPFLGDDYVFLDRTSGQSFQQLWSFSNTQFGWYRPWSREFHFWALQHIADHDPAAFRAINLLLWLSALLLYGVLLGGIMSQRSVAIAVAIAATLTLWGTPLLWISGSQDLWMLVFGLLALVLIAARKDVIAAVCYALALLSKETAAVIPLMGFAHIMLVQLERPRRAVIRTLPFVVLTDVWAIVHPTLLNRLLHGPTHTPELVEHRYSAAVTLTRELLSCLNLHVLPNPSEVTLADVARAFIAVASLSLALAVVLGAGKQRSTPILQPRPIPFLVLWMALGWVPLFLPSVGWHAYYGCLGALGACGVMGVALQPLKRSVICSVVAGLSLLHGAQSATRSWDWGDEWYQRRAGALLAAIKEALMRQHPVLPHHTRVYFTHIPNNIGLVAGNSPALRVWYADKTLESDFYSKYQPRAQGAPTGPDLFFRFDTTRCLVEVRLGAEDVPAALRENLSWRADHIDLGMLMVGAGDLTRAAEEFEKLSVLPDMSRGAVFAAACRRSLGKGTRADSLESAASRRYRCSRDSIRVLVDDLIRTLPGRH